MIYTNNRVYIYNFEYGLSIKTEVSYYAFSAQPRYITHWIWKYPVLCVPIDWTSTLCNRCERVCAIFGCGNHSKRDQEKSFFRLPSITTNEGTQTESLSRKRQDTWPAKIKREDILPEQYYNTWVLVCSDHFVSGVP